MAYPCPNIRTRGIEFDFIPEIHVLSDEVLTEAEMLSLVEVLYKVISFLFMRTNIIPDYIRYYSNNLQYDIHYRKAADYIEESEDVNSSQKMVLLDGIRFIRAFKKSLMISMVAMQPQVI